MTEILRYVRIGAGMPLVQNGTVAYVICPGTKPTEIPLGHINRSLGLEGFANFDWHSVQMCPHHCKRVCPVIFLVLLGVT